VSEQLSQMDKLNWQTLAVMTAHQIEFMYTNFSGMTWRSFVITGFTHWCALEEMFGDNKGPSLFSVADAQHAMEKRWPDEDWPWNFCKETFQKMVKAGKLKQKKKGRSGVVLYRVTEKYKEDIREFYRTSTKTAELLLANYKSVAAKIELQDTRDRFDREWKAPGSTERLGPFPGANARLTREHIFGSASLFRKGQKK